MSAIMNVQLWPLRVLPYKNWKPYFLIYNVLQIPFLLSKYRLALILRVGLALLNIKGLTSSRSALIKSHFINLMLCNYL